MGEHKNRPPEQDTWSCRRDTLKNQWVFAVGAFWVTVAVGVSIYVLKGEVNLILVSIALGTMFLGIWTKARYQLHLRKAPADQSTEDAS